MTAGRENRPQAAAAGASRDRRSFVFIIVLITLMVSAVVASVVYVAAERAKQGEVRQTAREIRMLSQALVETDLIVLRSLSTPGTKPDTVAYGRALSRLEALGTARLPNTVKRGANDVSGAAVYASLTSAFDDIIGMLEADAGDAAKSTYSARLVSRDMDALLASFRATLDDLEARYQALQQNVDNITWACLVGQILTGLISIIAFAAAARNGRREAKARARAVEHADSTREQVVRLFEMTDMLQSAADHADANAVLVSTASELLPGFGGALYVFNNSRDRLTLSTHWGMNGDGLVDAIGLQQCWALKRGKPHVNRPDSHKLCCEHHLGADHALEIPMIARGEILGLMQFHADGAAAEARLDGIAGVGAALADAMSLALANLGLRDKLRSQALRDPLTGLYNRRYMEDTLERLVRLGERDKSEVSLVMIDLDHFKRLNDNYGHAKGDAVLRDTAAFIIGNLRESDVACRYGGEELLVILPHCGLEMAAAKAERLRLGIEALTEPNGAQVSASFGVACIPDTSAGARELLAAADAALYVAKQEGRNRVVCAPLAERPASKLEDDFMRELDAAE